MDDTKSKLINILISSITLITIIGGIVGMLIFHKTNPPLMFIILGGILFIMGTMIFLLTERKLKDAKALLVSLVGLAIIGLSTSYLLDVSFVKKNIGIIIVYLILSCFVIIGLFIVLNQFFRTLHLKKNCTSQITATCVELERVRNNRVERSSSGIKHAAYYSIYAFQYGGEQYRVRSTIATNVDLPKLNEELTIYVNPENPNMFYRPSLPLQLVIYGLGFAFITLGSYVIMLVSKQF